MPNSEDKVKAVPVGADGGGRWRKGPLELEAKKPRG